MSKTKNLLMGLFLLCNDLETTLSFWEVIREINKILDRFA